MIAQPSFSDMARRELADLALTHQLGMEVVHEHEILLRGESFVVSFSLDRDGVNCMYYDLQPSNPRGYNLGMFLMNKRRHLLNAAPKSTPNRSMAEIATSELAAFKRHLISAGTDVLGGSKLWLSEYPWPSVEIPDRLNGNSEPGLSYEVVDGQVDA